MIPNPAKSAPRGVKVPKGPMRVWARTWPHVKKGRVLTGHPKVTAQHIAAALGPLLSAAARTRPPRTRKGGVMRPAPRSTLAAQFPLSSWLTWGARVTLASLPSLVASGLASGRHVSIAGVGSWYLRRGWRGVVTVAFRPSPLLWHAIMSILTGEQPAHRLRGPTPSQVRTRQQKPLDEGTLQAFTRKLEATMPLGGPRASKQRMSKGGAGRPKPGARVPFRG